VAGSNVPRIAVLGLGEAGRLISADLVAAGAEVHGYDPAVSAPGGVVEAKSEAQAAADCDLVLSLNSAHDAWPALQAGLDGARPGSLWADLNTAAPGLKRELEECASAAGVLFADVEMMSTVPGKGLGVPMLTSGAGAERYRELMAPLGAQVEVLAGPAGLAAQRKLLRSIFFKGAAAAVVEAVEAARAAGCEEWLRANIATEIARWEADMVDRLFDGSHTHAVRRTAEMQAATDMLSELGLTPTLSPASRDVLRRLSNQD
jgi:3-hydroxyisobutyrate dehydrogenase-like beta-hydroxyacid dehydrogenase